MDLVIYLPLVVPLLAALAAGPLSRRLPPAAATWLLAGSALVLAAASSAVLGLLALTALFRIPLVDQVGGMSAPVFSRDDPASLPVAVAAGALLVISATAAGAGAVAPRQCPGCRVRSGSPPARVRSGRGYRRGDRRRVHPARLAVPDRGYRRHDARAQLVRAEGPAGPRTGSRRVVPLPVHQRGPAGRRRQPAAPPGRRRSRLHGRTMGR